MPPKLLGPGIFLVFPVDLAKWVTVDDLCRNQQLPIVAVRFGNPLKVRDQLEKELRAFGYELGATGKPRYEGKGVHDNIVTALSLALWGADHGVSIGRDFKAFMRKDIERRRALWVTSTDSHPK